VELATGQVVGVEALLRWHSRDLGEISPARFVPVAEESGMIVPIGKWVLKNACSQLKKWESEGINGVRLAVNFSPLQFRQATFVDCIEEVIGLTGVRPDQLELEITESTLMESSEHTIDNLNYLSERGFHIAIDDFGTGYSSLNYLKRFPVDRLKIDQSFVRDIDSDADDAAIVSAIIAMARNLNLHVLAEGVETKEHSSFLQALHCDEAQGFHYSRPLPVDEVEAVLRAGMISVPVD
jgi:EAL domain-containing protein (putative c-di-GMP-specific phosphodiesterase class I)